MKSRGPRGRVEPNPLALDTVEAIDGVRGTLPILLADPVEHGRRYGGGCASEAESIALSRELRAMVLRPAASPAPILSRLRLPRRCPQGGRPRGRRTRRSSRAGPSDDEGGEHAPPIGGAR
jgi:hypothetical protein